MNCFPIIPSSSLQAVSTGKRWGRGLFVCFLFFFSIFGLFASDFNYPLKENKKGSPITVTIRAVRLSQHTARKSGWTLRAQELYSGLTVELNSFHLSSPWRVICVLVRTAAGSGKRVQGNAAKLVRRNPAWNCIGLAAPALPWGGKVPQGPVWSVLAQEPWRAPLGHNPQSELLPHGLSSHSTSCSSMTSTFESLLSHLT